MPRRNTPTKTNVSNKKRAGHVSRARTPPYPEWNDWSTARFWGWIRAILRKGWLRWPPRYQVLADAKHYSPDGWRWKCSECGEGFKNKDVEVDHITPVGTLRDVQDLPTFVSNLFVAPDKLRVVCKPCHKRITHGDKA